MVRCSLLGRGKSVSGGNMFDRRHPLGWLFYLLLTAAVSSAQTSPTTTTVSDTVFRADGTLAGGTLLISWPTFSTPAGQSVAAGKKSVTLGTGGTLSVALVPNATGTFYTVVYQLDDSSTPPKIFTLHDRLAPQVSVMTKREDDHLGHLFTLRRRGKTVAGGTRYRQRLSG